MSTLLVDPLTDGFTFTQNFKIPEQINLAYLRLWIYKNGTLTDGVLTLDIKKGAIILKTMTIDYTLINEAIPGTYGHGYIRFDVEGLPLFVTEGSAEEEYTLDFYMDSHTTDPDNYIAVVREYDNRKYDTYGVLYSDSLSSAGLEFYTYRSYNNGQTN